LDRKENKSKAFIHPLIKNQLSCNPSPVPSEAGGIFYSPIFERRKIRKTATEKAGGLPGRIATCSGRLAFILSKNTNLDNLRRLHVFID
jgi:hypothetical protein